VEGSCSRGYSLIEVLMALTVLSILILPLLSLFVYGIDYSHWAGRETKGAAYAHDMMEHLKAEGFRSLKQQISTDYFLVPEEDWEEIGSYTRYYSLQMVTKEMAYDEDFLNIELLLIEVYVEWDEREREIVLTSYLAPGDER